jgi:hypothetical protein
MKHIIRLFLLSFTLLSTPLFAENIYCPRSIACDSSKGFGECTGIPDNFYVSHSNISFNDTYYFQIASDYTTGAHAEIHHITCRYETANRGTLFYITLAPRQPIKPDRDEQLHIPLYQWISIDAPGVIVCLNDVTRCPFTLIR